MKQVVRRGIREMIVDEVPEPVVTPYHVIVRPVYSLISSGTESASIHQKSVVTEVARNPSQVARIYAAAKIFGPWRTLAEVKAKFSEYGVLGYSGAGIVAEKHPTVSDLEVGERVAYGGEGTGHGECILTGRKLVARVPDSVPFEQACFATLGSIALNAVRIAAPGLGETVAVIGLGIVGQLIAQLARLQGGRVIAIDLKPERIALALRLGADHALAAGESLPGAVGALTDGRGTDCVIVAAAGKSSAPCEQALRICRDRGRLVIVGAVEMSFPWNDMYLKEVRLFMSRAYGPGSYDPVYEKQGRDYPLSYVRWTENRNLEEFLRLLAAGRVEVQPLVTHEFPLERAPEAYQAILAPESASLAVLLRYGPSEAPPEARQKTEIRASNVAPGEIGVALVGPGGMARWAHLPNLKKIPGVRLLAIHSSSGVRAKSTGLRFGASYCTTDYEQVLKDPDIGLVVITSRNQYHAGQAEAALRAGKHVFVEKPMALAEEECRRLWRAVEETGNQLTVGFNRRFAPFYTQLKQRLARRSGPAVLNCRVNSPGISGAYWMADPAIGGAILGEACHFIDLMYWLLASEPVSVFAYSLPTGRQEPVGENNIAASFRFADGCIGNLTYCTVGSTASGGERVEAFTPGLGIVTEDFKRLTVKTAIGRTKRALWADKGYAAQLDSFIEGIRAGRPPEVTALDGIRATIGCLRMLESARTHAPCNISLEEITG